MAPYAFAVVGIGVVSFIAHLILKATQRKFDFVWYRQLWSYKKLPTSQKQILKEYPFYKNLNAKDQRHFEHRVKSFIADKNFKHRHNHEITDEHKVLVAAVACRLTFGRRSYLFPMLNTILIFDEAFESPANNQKHKGEYNPRAKVLALSWADFKEGIDIANDNLHLGLHEFTHVMHFESERYTDVDAERYGKFHKKILRELMKPETREKVDNTRFFRDYAFTNQYEFMAVLTEYYFESNAVFKQEFPVMYNYMTLALLYRQRWIV
jgi:hypothetical protein